MFGLEYLIESFFQSIWMCLSESFFFYALFNTIYYGTNLILYFVDTSGLLLDMKCQKVADKEKHISEIKNTYQKCLPISLRNTLLWSIPTVLTLPPLINIWGYDFTWGKFILDIVLSYFLMDFIFYWSHRFLHHDDLYIAYHKQHHEIIAPVGLSATYMTVVDFYANILSIYLPPILISSNKETVIIWVIISTLNTIFVGHSGYSPIANFHDNHHKYFNCNYGVGVFTDKLFGTCM